MTALRRLTVWFVAACAARPGVALSTAGILLLITLPLAGLSTPLTTAAVTGPVLAGHALLIGWPTLADRRLRGRSRGNRGVRLLAVAVLTAGVSIAGAGLLRHAAPLARLGGVPVPGLVALHGLALAEAVCLLGLVLIPGTPLTTLGRVCRTLDGVAMSTCGFFVAWLVLFTIDGVRDAGLIAILLSCTTFCGMVIVGLRSAAGRGAAIACGGGIALAIAGLTLYTVALAYDEPVSRLTISSAALVAAPPLIRRGTRAVLAGGPVLDPIDSDTDFGGYPLLALPLVAALAAWVHHVLVRGTFDTIAIVLAVAAVLTVAARAEIASFDARRYAERLSMREQHFRSLFARSTDVIMVFDPELRVRWQSPAAARQLGLSDQDVVGRLFVSLLHPEDSAPAASALDVISAGTARQPSQPVESRLRDGSGQWRDVEWSIVDHRSVPAVGALVVHVRDVADRRRLRHTLRRMALVDHLTGLPNRCHLGRAVADWHGDGVLMVLRLTGVATINDVRGHDAGDAVLAEAALRIRQAVAHTDLPIRLDRDRFAVLTGEGAIQAQFLATRLVTILSEPYQLPGGPAHLSGNAGLAELVADADESLRRADLALRPLRDRSRGGAVEWYDESIETERLRELTVERALPGLLDRRELDLLYQPVVELSSRRPVGVEVVLRWRHPDLGEIPATEFMPLAEHLGIAAELHHWMLDQTFRQLATWSEEGTELWLATDLTPGQLLDPTIVPAIGSAIEYSGIEPSRLVFEITEADLTTMRPEVRQHHADIGRDVTTRTEVIMGHLAALRTLGARVALDHFGTASTTLNRIRLLPVDLLKVDRELLDPLKRRSGSSSVILDGVVRFGQQLGMAVAVQGLASGPDLEAARTAGCQFGQGDLICRALPAEHLTAYLADSLSGRP